MVPWCTLHRLHDLIRPTYTHPGDRQGGFECSRETVRALWTNKGESKRESRGHRKSGLGQSRGTRVSAQGPVRQWMDDVWYMAEVWRERTDWMGLEGVVLAVMSTGSWLFDTCSTLPPGPSCLCPQLLCMCHYGAVPAGSSS
jgi:hypothetical protein